MIDRSYFSALGSYLPPESFFCMHPVRYRSFPCYRSCGAVYMASLGCVAFLAQNLYHPAYLIYQVRLKANCPLFSSLTDARFFLGFTFSSKYLHDVQLGFHILSLPCNMHLCALLISSFITQYLHSLHRCSALHPPLYRYILLISPSFRYSGISSFAMLFVALFLFIISTQVFV